VTEVEPPEDEQQSPEPTGQDVPVETAEETPAETAEETPAETGEETPADTAEETPADTAEETPADTAEETPAETAEEAAPEESPAAPAPAAEQTPAEETPAEESPAAPGPTAEPAAAEAESSPERDEDGEDIAPRQRPEIPGADLIPDIVSESSEFLDAEARAAAEADAELAALAGDDDSSSESQPIADAAIDLAAGARYTATGKRKTAVARVILKPGTGTYLINGKTLDVFFPRDTLQRVIRHPLETVGYDSRMDVIARMHGGGVAAQAGALRHGIARALLVADPNLRGELKRRGFLTRDPRVKERKKAGLKKARKRPQFSKR
jgi:small subunit ribosomal protein S9